MAGTKIALRPSTKLSKGAKKIFRELAKVLIPDSRLRADNKIIFEALCSELDLYFTIDVPEEEMIVAGQNGSQVINPLIRERRNILTNATNLAKEFGLTPKGLHALGMFAPKEKKASDPIADMMAKRRKLKAI